MGQSYKQNKKKGVEQFLYMVTIKFDNMWQMCVLIMLLNDKQNK